jgi:hypothetical protein
VELIPGEVQTPRILIFMMTIPREKIRMLSKRNLLQENLPMRMKIM